jgi:hypothetical protein
MKKNLMITTTVGELLDQYSAPPLEEGSAELLSTMETTVPARVREYDILTRWVDFENEMNPAIEVIRQKSGEHVCVSFPKPKSVYNEEDVTYQFKNFIEHPLEVICQSVTGRSFCFYGASTCQTAKILSLNPDRVWCIAAPRLSARCVIEMKTPWALQFAEEPDGAVDFIRQADYAKDSSKYRRAVQQLYIYMTWNNLRFGILSTYKWTFILKRVAEDGFLQISPGIPHTELVKRMTQLFVLIDLEEHWMYAESPPDVSRQLETSVVFPARRQKYNLRILRPQQFIITEILGAINSGTVCIAQISGISDQVFLKIKDLSKGHTLYRELDHEVAIYEALSSLQGTAIPKFIGYFDYNGLVRGLALERFGNKITQEQARENRDQIINVIRRIHLCGFIHGDI